MPLNTVAHHMDESHRIYQVVPSPNRRKWRQINSVGNCCKPTHQSQSFLFFSFQSFQFSSSSGCLSAPDPWRRERGHWRRKRVHATQVCVPSLLLSLHACCCDACKHHLSDLSVHVRALTSANRENFSRAACLVTLLSTTQSLLCNRLVRADVCRREQQFCAGQARVVSKRTKMACCRSRAERGGLVQEPRVRALAEICWGLKATWSFQPR